MYSEIMTLKNFWLPLLWVLGSGFVLRMMPKKTELVQGISVERWFWGSAFLMVLPLILWAGARRDYGDTFSYIRHFAQAPTSLDMLPSYLKTNSKDQGFSVLIILCKSLGCSTFTMFFTLIAVAQLLCIVHTYRKYSDHFWTCIFLFVASTDYVAWMFNGMRQFLAAAITFAGFGFIVKKQYIPFFLLTVLAAQFHASAYLMIPLVFIIDGPSLNRRTLLMILAVAISLPFLERIVPALSDLMSETQYGDITSNEVWAADDGTNMLRVLVYSVPALIAIFGHRYLKYSGNRAMNLCVNASMVSMAIYVVSGFTSGIYVGRLPIYMSLHSYMALPWMLDQIFEKHTVRLIKLLMIGFYIVFYYFQLGVTWGML